MIKKRQIILLLVVLLIVGSLSAEWVEGFSHKKIGGFLGDIAHGAGDLLGGALDSIKECFGLCPSKDCEAPVNFVPIEKNLDKTYQVRKIEGNVCYRASGTDSSLPELFDITYELNNNGNLIKSSKTSVFTVNNDCKKECADFEVDLSDNLLKKLTDSTVYPVANKVALKSFNVHHYTYHLGSSLGNIETSQTEETRQSISNTAKSQYTFTGPILIYTTGPLDDFNTLPNKLKGGRNIEVEIKSKLDPTFSITGNVLAKYSQLWILNNGDADISQAKAAVKGFYNNGGGLFIASHDGFVTNFITGIKKTAMDFSWEKFTNTNIDQNINYAQNIAEFLEPNPYENEVLCKHRGGKWTGSSCCGLADKDNKDWYYNDAVGFKTDDDTAQYGGCWNNKFVATGTNPSEIITDAQGNEQTKTLKQVINVNGEFHYCKNLLPQLLPPSIRLTFPNGGEKLKDGETHRITWNSAGAGDKVSIGISTPIFEVVKDAPNIGYYDWTPSIGETTKNWYESYYSQADVSAGYPFTMYIESRLGKTVFSDTSDATFTLLPKDSTTSSTQSPPPTQLSSLASFNLKPVSTCGKITITAGDFKVNNKFVTCNYSGEFEFKTEMFDSNPKSSPSDINQKNCCTINQCFNSTKCVGTFDSTDLEAKKGSLFTNPDNKQQLFLCNKDAPKTTASWDELFLKSTPDGKMKEGDDDYYCRKQTQCLLEPRSLSDATKLYDDDVSKINYAAVDERPHCVESGRFFEDRYCKDGEWTSKTKFLIEQLLAYGSDKDFELSCGKPDEILNDASGTYFGDFRFENKLKYKLLPRTNNVCVLKSGNNVLFGTTLNVPVDDKNSIIEVMDQNNNCKNAVNSNFGEFQECGGKDNKKIFYNPIINSAVFSSDAIPANTLGFGKLQTEFDAIKNTATSLTDEEEKYKIFSNAKYFDTIFYQQKANKKIFGFLEKVIRKQVTETTTNFDPFLIMGIKYTQTGEPLRQGDCAELQNKIEFGSTKSICKLSGPDSIIVLLRTTPSNEERLKQLWNEITQKLRLT